MGLEDRLDSMIDAMYHAKELMNALKQLGNRYLNTVDVIDDIRREIEIDEAITERRLNELQERELKALTREYCQTT